VNSLPNTVIRQRRGCDLNPGPSAPESSTLTTRLPSHPKQLLKYDNIMLKYYFYTSTAHYVSDISVRMRVRSDVRSSVGSSGRWHPDDF